MRIGPAAGAHLTLEPLRYEYPGLVSASSDDWFDANWLVICGTVQTADARTWTFRDPCLLTSEALDLSRWLRRVSAGDVDPLTMFDELSRHAAAFTEPNLAFTLFARTGDHLVLRAHLSMESGPPWRSPDDEAYVEPYVVDLDVSSGDLEEAATTWERELDAFPVRGSL
ncbi:hypothetical protein [Actinotalea sp. C106]|uniref:WapI family immunity protein n=1 Tax=Actinotalea sp. C106 TaxID=2908644 RepID=UPI00202775A2|nr:hypothetical protein [Actinotalea sp. C106]